MAKTSVLKNAKRFTFNAEEGLVKAAKRRACGLGYNYSEYLSRLMVADLRRENSATINAPRIFRVMEKSA